MGHYQRSLEVSERLLVANPESAQAARDVSVSLNKLADFLARRGLAGRRGESVGPLPAQSGDQRTAAGRQPGVGAGGAGRVGELEQVGGLSGASGLGGRRGGSVGPLPAQSGGRERLLVANPESARRRDVLVSLERQAKAQSSRAGGAEAALGLQVRSLELALKLRERNSQSYHYQRTAAVSFWLTGQRLGRRKPGTRIAMPRRLFQRARFVGPGRRRR